MSSNRKRTPTNRKKRRKKREGNRKSYTVTVDLSKLVTKSFEPTIRALLGSLLVEVLDQFHRQQELAGIVGAKMDGRTIMMIESIKDEIASRFIKFHPEIMERLERVANLHMLGRIMTRNGK